MKKYEHFLSSMVVLSIGLNTYLVANMDKFLQDKEDFKYIPAETVVLKEVIKEERKEEEQKITTPKIDKKYSLVLGRENPFKPLVKEKSTANSKPELSQIPKTGVVSKVEHDDSPTFEVKGILQGYGKELIIVEKGDKGSVLEKNSTFDGYKLVKVDMEKEIITFQKNGKNYAIKIVGGR